MEKVTLESFVAETLKSISKGVRDAQAYSKKIDGIPIAAGHMDGTLVASGDQLIKFTISLQADVSKDKSISAGLGGTIVSVVTGNMSATGSGHRAENTTHSVEFSVPMSFHAFWTKKAEN